MQTFASGNTLTQCTGCPSNSNATSGQAMCTCPWGYGRADDDPTLACQRCDVDALGLVTNSGCTTCPFGQYLPAFTLPTIDTHTGRYSPAQPADYACTPIPLGFGLDAGCQPVPCQPGTFTTPTAGFASKAFRWLGGVFGAAKDSNGTASYVWDIRAPEGPYRVAAAPATTLTLGPVRAPGRSCGAPGAIAPGALPDLAEVTVDPSLATPANAAELASAIGLASSTPCLPCPPGTASAVNRSGACAPCAPNTFAATPFEAGCAVCPEGKLAPGTGSTACEACPLAKFHRGVVSLVCEACPAGLYGIADGRCRFCPRAKFASNPGATACAACAPGTFTLAVASAQCLDCPSGWTSSTNETGCHLCPPGTQLESAVCEACPAHKYNEAFGYPCEACPAGRVPNAERTACASSALGI